MTDVQIQALNAWARTEPALRGAFSYIPNSNAEPQFVGLGSMIEVIEGTADTALDSSRLADTRVMLELGTGSSSPEDIVTIPATKGIMSIGVAVGDVPFNTAAQLSIGTADEPELLMAEEEIDLSIGGAYVSTFPIVFSNDTQIKAFFEAGGSAAGSALIRLTYG